MQWRWLILIVAAVNVLAYTTCGILFYFDSWISGDFSDERGKNINLSTVVMPKIKITLDNIASKTATNTSWKRIESKHLHFTSPCQNE